MSIAEIGVIIVVLIFGGQLAFFLIMNILLEPQGKKYDEERQKKLDEANKIVEELNDARPCYKVGEKRRETLEETAKKAEECRRKEERLQQLLQELNERR